MMAHFQEVQGGSMRSLKYVLVATSLLVLALTVPVFAGESLKAEELVAKHLDSIGTAEVRAAAKTRAVQGTAAYRILVGGGGHAEGTLGLVSEGRKLRYLVRFQQDYRGENLGFNGEKVAVAFANSNQSRSPFAAFVSTYDEIMRDGLLGGTLSTAWALLDVSGRSPKLTYEGVKKLDGHPVHQLRYISHKHSDIEILLYFDAETFRHVRSLYTFTVGNNVGETITESAHLKQERSQLDERFSDFQTADGLTLPAHWNVQFTRELPNGSTTVTEWDLKAEKVMNNITLDPKNFEVK